MLEIHRRIRKIVNINEIYARITKSMKMIEIRIEITKIMKIPKNQCENDENHEKKLEVHAKPENHENYRKPKENY